MGSVGKTRFSRREFLQATALAGGSGIAGAAWAASARTVTLVRSPDDPVAGAAPVEWATQELGKALAARNVKVHFQSSLAQSAAGSTCILVSGPNSSPAVAILRRSGVKPPSEPESLALARGTVGGRTVLLACGADARGLVYAVLELADRVNYGDDAIAALAVPTAIRERPANTVRSVDRCFLSDVEDKPWYNDEAMWAPYLTMLATQRFNRFTLSFGIGYDYPHVVTDAYFYFAYPFLLDVPGYKVRAKPLPDDERDQNLKMLRLISDQTSARGMEFHLGLWTHAYVWPKGSTPNYTIEGLTPETHAPYCRDALRALLEACPNISGLALRIHGESGIPEENLHFWDTVFQAIAQSGRKIEINMHAKGMSQPMIDKALAVGGPVSISPKYWAEHCGLPYQPSSIRQMEMPPTGQKQEGFFSLSGGSRRFLRYSYGDLLKRGRRYGVIYRIWPGTQRCLLWGDPVMAAAGSRTASFCGSQGMDLFEPLSFKGRHGSGQPGGRCAYQDDSLKPHYDWEKFLYSYRVWGRHLYNPDTPPDTWRRLLRKQYRAAAAPAEEALASASRILRLVLASRGPSGANNFYWPEIYTNLPLVDPNKNLLYRDSLQPRSFANVSPFDPEVFSRINEFVTARLKGEASAKYSPLEVAQWLEDLAEAAEKSLVTARARSSDPRGTEFRRMAVDVAIQSRLGRFFAWQIRSGTLFCLYNDTGDASALKEAVAAYRGARTHWANAATQAQGVYKSDITYGSETNLRGCWQDRLAAIDEDIDEMQSILDQLAKSEDAPAATDHDKVKSIVQEALSRPNRSSAPCKHVPPKRFDPGEPLALELSLEPRAHFDETTVRLRYRHVNQGEYYLSMEMHAKENVYSAVISGIYTDSPYALQYHFEISAPDGRAWLYPGLGADLSSQPYFVVEAS